MKIGSLFDGSGGFPLAASLCGITPTFASEVEPYPIAVTTSRFPHMRHIGDVSKINGATIEAVDVITFGSPCQDLSVAGKRAGLKHSANGDGETTRSGLFMEAVRIIKEMRRATNGEYPKFAVWENVPGAFSSNKGEDFRIVLEELIKISKPEAPPLPMPEKGKWPHADVIMGDGFSIAYRTFDAQYWGVPQRRRRIYLVADFTGQCAGEVLFERESLQRNPAESGSPRQDTSADAERGTGATDRERNNCLTPWDVQSRQIYTEDGPWMTLYAGQGGGRGYALVAPPIAIATQQGGAEISENGICPTVTASAGMSGNNQPWICHRNGAPYGMSCKGNGECFVTEETHYTLATGGGQPGQGYPCVIQPVAFTQNQRDEVRSLGDKAGCLQAEPGMKQQTFILDNIGGQAEYGKESEVNGTLRSGAQGAIAYVVENHPADSRVNIDESGKCQTLTSRMGTGGGNVPMVMEAFCKSGRGNFKGDARANELVVETVALEGNGQRPSHRGDGYAVTDKSYTLNATEVHGVAYGISSYDSNAMKSSNPHSGIYEASTSRTLDLNGGNPACNQGGIAIVEELPIITSNKASFFMRTGEELANTIVATDYKEPPLVCYGLDRASFSQGKNAQFGFSVLQEQQPTLTAKGPGAVAHETYQKVAGPLMANPHPGGVTGQDAFNDMLITEKAKHSYIVRRLTPTECARLQGFPDTWGYP